MLNIWAFKLALLSVLPYMQLIIRREDIHGITSNYMSIKDVQVITTVTFNVPSWETDIRVARNNAQKYILADIPTTIRLCDMIAYFVQPLSCSDPATVTRDQIVQHFSGKLVSKVFGLTHFSLHDDFAIYTLLISNSYDFEYIAQSFPILFVNNTDPIPISSVCTESAGCRTEPNWGQFMGNGIRDTLITYGMHYASPIAWRWAKTVWQTIRGTPAAVGADLSSGLTQMTPGAAVDILGGVSTSSLSSSSLYELAPLSTTPAGVATGIVVQSAQRGTDTVRGLSLAARPWQSLPELTASALETLSAGRVATVAVEASVLAGATRVTTTAATTPAIWSRVASVLRSLRFKRSLIPDGYVPIVPKQEDNVPTTQTNNYTNTPTVTERSAAVGASSRSHCCQLPVGNSVSTSTPGIPKWFKTYNKTLHPVIRKRRSFWSASRKIISRVPGWTYPTILSGATWVAHGLTYLPTSELKVETFYPIVKLTELERFYTVALSLMLQGCFKNETLRTTVRQQSPSFSEVLTTVGGKQYTPLDIVMNLKTMHAGPIVHACSPLFKTPISGLPKDFVRRSLSMTFSAKVIVDDLFFYTGLPDFIDGERAAYINDIVPRFKPLIGYAEIDNDSGDFRSKRQLRSARLMLPKEYGDVDLNPGGDFVTSVEELMSHPRTRYEFDIIVSSVYNTSANYFRNIRHYMQQSNTAPKTLASPVRVRIVPGVTISELTRSVDQYSFEFPRINIMRELLDGYKPRDHLRRIQRSASSVAARIQHNNLLNIMALVYLTAYPTDVLNAQKIADGNLTSGEVLTLVTHLYKEKYARIPFLVILDGNTNISEFREMLVVNSRDTKDLKTWRLYSPYVVTDATHLIPSASYSMCVSKRRSSEELETPSLFLPENSPQSEAFKADCDLASIHITYTHNLSELFGNAYLPARISTVLSAQLGGASKSTAEKEHAALDPLLSEILDGLDSIGEGPQTRPMVMLSRKGVELIGDAPEMIERNTKHVIKKLYDSLPDRMIEVISKSGGSTKY